MKSHLSFCLALICLSLLSNCVSYSSFQTARTLEKGKIAGTAGIGSNQAAENLYYDVAIRAGLEEGLDGGLKFNHTIDGSRQLMLDVKKQIEVGVPEISCAVGLASSQVFDEDRGFIVHLPAYLSFHTSTNRLSAYFNPRVFYYLETDPGDEQSDSGFGVGTSVGLKIGKDISVMPEWSVIYGDYRGPELNNLFSLGFGFRIP